jgi:tetratricopeptide (TPR) repeat protein
MNQANSTSNPPSQDSGNSLQPLLAQLDEAESRQDWTRTESLCKQILQQDSEQWAIWQRLALSLEARNDWTQAETLWRHLTQRFAQRPEPYLALASLQRKRGAPDAARLVLEQAERRLGRTSELEASLGVIDDPWANQTAVISLSAEAPATQIADALQKAQQHLEAGRLAEAEAAFEQLTLARPQSKPFQLNLAQLRWRRGDVRQVIAQLEPLFSLPLQPGPLVKGLELPWLLAKALHADQQWQRLSPLLSELQQLAPGEARILLMQAEVALANNQDLLALPLLRQTLAMAPGMAQAELALGQVLIRLGDWAGAIQSLERAIAQAPDLEAAALSLEQARSELLWQQGETALAAADWEKAKRNYSALMARGNEPRALKRLELLASLDPHNLAPEPGNGSIKQPGSVIRLAQFSSALDRLEALLH